MLCFGPETLKSLVYLINDFQGIGMEKRRKNPIFSGLQACVVWPQNSRRATNFTILAPKHFHFPKLLMQVLFKISR